MKSRALSPVLVLAAVVAAGLVGTAGAATAPLASRALTTSRTCMLTGVSNANTVALETYVDQASPNSSAANITTTFVRSSSNANRRTYVRFDLTKCVPAIPSTATVTEAVFRAYMDQLPTACRTQDVFRVTASWVETVTWNTQPFGTAINNPPTAQRTGSMNVGAAPCTNSTNNAYVTGWNVTTDVAAFVAGTATNYGWMIRDDVEGSSTSRNARYVSSEANQPPRGPQLIVTYDP
ncbi:MAG: DNRLRE domain-containing protein [Actinomycetota bacterium]